MTRSNRFGRRIEDAGPVQRPRVIDEQIDPPEPLQRLGRHALDLLGVANVNLHRQRLRTQRLHLGGDREDRAGQLLRRLRALRRDDDVASGFRQSQRDGAADPRLDPVTMATFP